MIGEPFIKHLEGEIWELRPLRDRILFAAWLDDSLFCFIICEKDTKDSKTGTDEGSKSFR